MVKKLNEFRADHTDGAAGIAFVPGSGENAPTAKPRRADNMSNKEGLMKQGSSDVRSGLEKGSGPGQAPKRRADKDGNKEGKMMQGSSGVKSGLEGGSGPGSMGNDGEGHMKQGSSDVKSGLEPASYSTEDKMYAILDQMAELSEEEIDEIYASLMEEEDYDEEEVLEDEEIELPDPFEKVKLSTEDIADDLDFGQVFEGDDLTEDFKSKATTIFESAVVAAVNKRLDEALDKLEDVYAHEVGLVKEELTGQLDSYLEDIVEEWVEENALAVEVGIKHEIMEDFIAGLKTLFAENYVEIPEEKVDVVEELEDRIDDLTGRLDEAVNDNLELREAIETFMKEGIIMEVTEGMTEMDAEKLRSFAENIEFESDEDFREKLATLKENYAPKTASLNESDMDDTLHVADDDEPRSLAERYAGSIQKQVHGRPFSLKNS